MSAVFTTVSVRNDSGYVISVFLNATAEDVPWNVESGNYGLGVTHTLQVPTNATNISIEIRGEAFIDDWKTVFQDQWDDTSTWPSSGLTYHTTGTAFKMHCYPGL